MKKAAASKFPLLLLLFSAPFHYFSIGESFRVILAIVALFYIAFFLIYGVSFLRNVQVGLLLFMVLLTLVTGVAVGALETFFAALVFFLLAAWPAFATKRAIRDISLDSLARVYLTSAAFVAVGVSCQIALYGIGIEFGKIDTMANRTGFGFLWLDYSLVSLFLTSAIPLVKFLNSNGKKIIVVCLLLAGSFLTTARTGIAALVLFLLLMPLFSTGRLMLKGRISLFGFIAPIFLLGIGAVVIYFIAGFSDREITLSGSGRLEGYSSALKYFESNFLMGAGFDADSYKYTVDTLPHNVFIYMLAMGGLLAFIPFLTWLIALFREAKSAPPAIYSCLVIAFIGFQFVPSFFAAYFFALLISLQLLSRRQRYGLSRLSDDATGMDG